MNVERLKILARYLVSRRVTPTHKFNLESWRYKTSCGTVCCAIGDATRIKKFKAEGLHFNTAAGTPEFGSYKSWAAAREFFELSKDQTYYLFYGVSTALVKGYPNGFDTTPKEVAARIRSFIKSGGKVELVSGEFV